MRLVDVLRSEEDAEAKAERTALVAAVMLQGFAEPDAEEVVDWGVDPDELRALIAKGCEKWRAVRILGRA